MAIIKKEINNLPGYTLGSGELYICFADDFDVGTMTTGAADSDGWRTFTESEAPTAIANMECMGYIQDDVTLHLDQSSIDIDTANHGVIDTIITAEGGTFSTNMISFDPEITAKYLTGHNVFTNTVAAASGQAGTKTMRIEANLDAVRPEVALVFVLEDKTTNRKITHYIPRAKWIGEVNVIYSKSNPTATDFTFKMLASKMPSGSDGFYFTDDFEIRAA